MYRQRDSESTQESTRYRFKLDKIRGQAGQPGDKFPIAQQNRNSNSAAVDHECRLKPLFKSQHVERAQEGRLDPLA